VAIGLQAGWLGVEPCDPARPVSVLHVHGTADENAPIAGGRGPRSLAGVDARPAIDSVGTLAAAAGCGGEPVADTDGDLHTTTYQSCAAGTDVVLLAVEGASHAWMGHDATSPAAERLVGAPYLELDASVVIWQFLAAHPRGP
jgi:polyhydroxybutyrate depolymerase